jgi:hypothetical protein
MDVNLHHAVTWRGAHDKDREMRCQWPDGVAKGARILQARHDVVMVRSATPWFVVEGADVL